MVHAVSDMADFDAKLADAGGKLVVVDFFATWCGPCKMIAPDLEKLQVEYSSSLVVLKVDVDDNEELAAKYSISAMPTFVLIKNKNTIETFTGANFPKLKALVEKNL